MPEPAPVTTTVFSATPQSRLDPGTLSSVARRDT
jgi:hypothetical protein